MLTTSVAETEMGQLHQKMTDINLTKNCKKAFADQVQKFSPKCKKKRTLLKKRSLTPQKKEKVHTDFSDVFSTPLISFFFFFPYL